jgi:hypothetical protein
MKVDCLSVIAGHCDVQTALNLAATSKTNWDAFGFDANRYRLGFDLIHCEVVEQLKYYNEVAEKYPNTKRRCVCCKNRVHNGVILCERRRYCRRVKRRMIKIYEVELKRERN